MSRQISRRAGLRRRRIGRFFDPDTKQGKRLGWLVTTTLAVLALVLGWAQIGGQGSDKGSPNTPDKGALNTPGQTGTPGLVVSAFSVAELQHIDATLQGANGQNWTGGKIDAPVIDLVVKNGSDQTAVLSTVQFQVTHIAPLPKCYVEGGPITALAHYDVKVPRRPLRPTPFVLKRDLRHEIKPGDVDRLVFSVGVEFFWETEPPWLIRVELSAKSDLDPSLLPLGDAVLVSSSGSPESFYPLDEAPDEEQCPAHLLRELEHFNALPGEKSPQLAALLEHARAFARR
jgi:hypothetical protein